MKKTITRFGAWLLVLTLLISAAPLALAAGEGDSPPAGEEPAITLSISGENTVETGKTITLTVSGQGENQVQWETSDEKIATVSGGVVTGVAAGIATITASVTVDGKECQGTHTVTVTAPAAESVEFSITGGTSVKMGETLTLKAVTTDNADITAKADWVSSDTKVATVSGGVVTPVAPGKTTVSAKYEDVSKEIKITVTASLETVTASVTGAPASMKIGDTAQLQAVLDVEGLTPATVTWTSTDKSKIDVTSSGLIKAMAAGKASITATVTLSAADQEKYTLANDGIAVTGEITVGSVVLDVDAPDKVQRLGTVTVTPTVSGLDDDAVINYSFSYGSKNQGSVTGDPTSVSTSNRGAVTVRGSKVGVATVTVSATVKDHPEIEIAPVTVCIGVYDKHEIEASTDSMKFKLSDEDVMDTLYKDGRAANTTLLSAMSASDATHIRVTVTEGRNVGSFSSSGWVMLPNCSLTFTALRSGTIRASYEVAAYNDKTYQTVAEGTLELTIGDAEGDIEYDLGSNGKVTFDESDFVRFWNDNKSANKYTGSLSYVKFDITTSVPYYGILYTTSSASKVVTTSHRAYYNYSATNNNYYCDLDQVTYVVDTKNYEGLTDTVPFTAYNDKGDGISGIIVINLGEGDATTITSRGVAFGTGGITEIIEANYKAATGKDLDYLTFSSVSASSGKLFYNFSNILNSTPVTTKYEFYVDPTGTQMDLDKVAFVPRAGLYGEVSIKYTGYDVNGKNSYEGKITFKVTQKTKSAVFSDVTATSYSWAADSVDFLYYEEVANGSNGKYNPKSNITRGDFMLMLYRAFLEEDYGNYNVTSNFPDVVKGTTSYSKETYQAVGVAKYLGIAQGSNGKYNPKAYITREEAMTLIYRTLDEVGYSMSYTVSTSTSSFSDYSSVSSYARAAIKDLIGHGVVIGTNGKIQPKSNITRAEMAVILHRVLTY